MIYRNVIASSQGRNTLSSSLHMLSQHLAFLPLTLWCILFAFLLPFTTSQSVYFGGLYSREDSTTFTGSNVGTSDVFKLQTSQSSPYYEGLVIMGWVNFASTSMARRVYLWTNEYSDGYLRTNYAN